MHPIVSPVVPAQAGSGRTLRASVEELVGEWVELAATAPMDGSFSVGRGEALRALFLCEASRFLNRPALHAAGIEILLRATEDLNEVALSTSLYGNVPGLGWALNELLDFEDHPQLAGFLGDLDDLLYQSIQADSKAMKIDLINGAAGLAVYAASREKKGGGRALAARLKEWLLSRFSYWQDRPNTEFVGRVPDGDLGVAHGIPGLLSGFSLLTRERGTDDRVERLLMAGFSYLDRFLVRHRSTGAYMPSFQYTIEPSRLAWCYGNLGVVFTYIRGCRFDASYAERVTALVKYALYQFNECSGKIIDTPICHGHAGAAFIFSRLATSPFLDEHLSAQCKNTSFMAAQAVLAAAHESPAVSGFPFIKGGLKTYSTSLLEGALGVCMAMMACCDVARPVWADLLLVE